MDLNTIKTKALSLVSYKLISPEKEGEKTTLNFYLSDFTEEVGKKGQKVIVPATISKRAVNNIAEICIELTDAEDKITAIAGTKGPKIVSLTDKKISGFGSWLDSRSEFETPEEKQMATRFLLGSMLSVIAENEKTVSQADPLLEAKRIFAKSGAVDSLNYTNAQAVFTAWETAELERVSRIMEKAKSLSAADLEAFINEKVASNGMDDDGYVLLRGKKADKDESK